MVEKLKHSFLIKFNIREARTKNVIKGSFSMLFSSLIGNVTRLGLVMILSRYFSKEEFGIWAAVTSAAAVIAYGDFGIINALRNKLSQLIVLGEEGMKEAQKYFFSSFIFFLFFSFIFSGFLLLLSKYIPFDLLFKTDVQSLKYQGVTVILWVQFLFFLNIPLSMGVVSFFSFHESRFSALFSIVQSVVSFAIVVILITLNMSIVEISIGYFVTSTLINLAGTIYFIKRRNWFTYAFIFKDFYKHIKELLSTGIKFMGFQLSNSFLQNAGTILASSFLGLSLAAEFNMVQKIYAFFSGIYVSMFNPVWGGYAEAAAKRDWLWCRKTLNISLFTTTIVYTVAIVIFFFFGNLILGFVAGKSYVSEPILFFLIGLIFLFNVLFSAASTFQNATSNINLMLVSSIIASILIFPVSKNFIGSFGIDGIALSLSILWIIMAFILALQSYRIINKNLKFSYVIR